MIYNGTHKFVAVVNKDLDTGKALNAIAHSCAGLAATAPESKKEIIEPLTKKFSLWR